MGGWESNHCSKIYEDKNGQKTQNLKTTTKKFEQKEVKKNEQYLENSLKGIPHICPFFSFGFNFSPHKSE